MTVQIRARDYSADDRARMAKSGEALPDGSFPIADREDLENAIQAIGRASDPAAAKAHIKKRAKALGLSELIPEGWNAVDPSELKSRLKRPLARLQNSQTDWYRIQNSAAGKPEVFIYDEIGYFGHSASDFANSVKEIDADEMTVHLNSPGGDIFDGLAIYQSLKNHKAKVNIVVDGLAASIASVIAMAADDLQMAPKATMMIHDGWSMSVGNAADMRKMADLLDKQSEIIASVYADRTGQPTNFWRDRMRDETWYNADEALAAGLIDSIEGQEAPRYTSFDLEVFAHAGRDTAPDPVTKPAAPVVEVKNEAPADQPKPEVKVEAPVFTWDPAAFKSALKEGLK